METFLKLQSQMQSFQFVFGIYFFILGMCIASFLNVVIFRYPKISKKEETQAVKEWLEEQGEKLPDKLTHLLEPISLSFPRSFCYSCKNQLKWYHNIPLFSWIFLRGKCGFCNSKISIQYPIIEIFGGLATFFLFKQYIDIGLIQFIVMTTFFFLCYAMFGIDWTVYDLPDNMTLPAMWIGLTAAAFGYGLNNISLLNSFYGVIAGYSLCWIIGGLGKILFRKVALGEGDYKLLAAVGAFTGITGAFFTFFAGALVGLVIVIIRKAMKIEEGHTPFGPALIITAFIWIFYKDFFIKTFNIPVF